MVKRKYVNYHGERLEKLTPSERRSILADINRAHRKAGNPPLPKTERIVGFNPRTKTLVTEARRNTRDDYFTLNLW